MTPSFRLIAGRMMATLGYIRVVNPTRDHRGPESAEEGSGGGRQASSLGRREWGCIHKSLAELSKAWFQRSY